MSGLRRLLWILAPILLLLAVISQTAELRTLAGIFSGARPLWLLAALGLQVAFAVNQGGFYQAVFRLLDADVPLRTAVWLSMVMAFASTASPVGTAAGVAYFVTAAREKGISPSRAFWVSLAYYFFDYSAFLIVLLVGLLVLFFRRDLHPSQLVVIAGFFAMVLGVAVVTVRALAAPALVPALLARAAAFVDRLGRRLRRRRIVDQDRIAGWGRELQEVIGAIRRKPRRALRPFLHALVVEAIGLITLAAVFSAIGYPLHASVLVAGYAIGVFFMIVSVTPSGVGVTEGAMIVTFTSLFVPLETAVAAALLFRLFTFWLPLVAGFLSLHLFPVQRLDVRRKA